jgi:hypothetical protein
MKPKIDKHSWTEVGTEIIICLARCERVHTEFSRNLVPGSIHTITDRPNRKALKNGDKGVWVNGSGGPVYVLFYEWLPYESKKAPEQMVRTKRPLLVRTK